jgi:hypothetical protein
MEGALHTRSWGVRGRRGQSDAVSWAARIFGMVVVVLLVSSWSAAALATAATRGHGPELGPQRAPTSGAATRPTPDPAPQATTTAPVPHRSTSTSPAIRVPAVVAPAIRPPVVVTPARTLTAPAAKIVASRAPRARSGRPTSPSHVHAARTPAPRRARSEATRLSFPLSWTKDLLLLPDRALHGGETGHRDGVLLLLSSLAMAVLAVASLALLRRLRRVELR